MVNAEAAAAAVRSEIRRERRLRFAETHLLSQLIHAEAAVQSEIHLEQSLPDAAADPLIAMTADADPAAPYGALPERSSQLFPAMMT